MTDRMPSTGDAQTCAGWLARASKRDRLLVWQNAEPIDLPLPTEIHEAADVRRAVKREFARKETT
jgi:hypothetical protein